jgi:hypothetical protein
MKNKNLILSVLVWILASSIMAITLPSSPYETFVISNDTEQAYSLAAGTTIKNHSTLGSSNYEQTCSKEETVEIGECNNCCAAAVGCSPTDYACLAANSEVYAACMGYCQGSHLGSLDANVMVLISMVIAYAGFMFYRRRKENAEQP